MRSKLLFALAGATLAICVGSAAAAPRGVGDAATLRSGPGPRWPVIALIPAEAQVDVLNCGPGWENDWCHVRYGNKTGYLHAGALAPSASGNNVIVAPFVTADMAYVRSGPGRKWPVVARMPGGTEVNSSGCVQGWGTNWCRVDIGGKPGYVNEVVLNRSGALFAP
jgi:uncharacterized protein YraI